jgi:hypothetical protein
MKLKLNFKKERDIGILSRIANVEIYSVRHAFQQCNVSGVASICFFRFHF